MTSRRTYQNIAQFLHEPAKDRGIGFKKGSHELLEVDVVGDDGEGEEAGGVARQG